MRNPNTPYLIVKVVYESGKRKSEESGKQRLEFHKVELLNKGGIVVDTNSYPILLRPNSNDKMFVDKSNNKLFVIGHFGFQLPPAGYVLDSKNHNKFEFDHFTFPKRYPDCVILDGKIYHFENPGLAHLSTRSVSVPSFLEIIDLPRGPSVGMIADPPNKRILLNFSGKLYAYYIADREFKLIAEGVHAWRDVLALAGNLLCVYDENALYAYHLSKKKTAQKLKVIWEESASEDFKFRLLSYKSLFYVGNNNFWFAGWCPENRRNSTLCFIKFRVRRQGNDLICTPLELRQHFLQDTNMIFDFALLQEEEEEEEVQSKVETMKQQPLAANSHGETKGSSVPNETVDNFFVEAVGGIKRKGIHGLGNVGSSIVSNSQSAVTQGSSTIEEIISQKMESEMAVMNDKLKESNEKAKSMAEELAQTKEKMEQQSIQLNKAKKLKN